MQSPLRILLCRLGFFLFALLPTCLVAAWAMQRSQPVYQNAQHADWERFLSQRTSLVATIAQVSYPSYWVARLDGLRLSDPESQQVLVECRSFEAARTKTAWIVEGSQPKLHLDRLGELARLLDERILREVSAGDQPVEFEIGEVTLQFGQHAQSITQVIVVVRAIESGAEAVAQFHIAGNEANAPCRLTVRRLRGGNGDVTTSWELIADSVALPCSLTSGWLTSFEALGGSAQFIGHAKGTVNEHGTTAELTGRFVNVDLDALVTPHSAHRLSGLAEVTVEPLRFEGGRIVELQGTIDCRGGYVSESLLTAAREHGRFGTDVITPAAQDGLVPYRRLAARFHATAGGVTIKGTADPTRDGVILASASQALLLDPTRQPLPAVALVRILVPSVEWQVPAAQETIPLLQAFPPAAVREANSEAIARPRVKLHE